MIKHLCVYFPVVFLICAMFAACSGSSKKTGESAATIQQAQSAENEEKLFSKGLEQLKGNQPEDAIESFQKFQSQHVTSRYTVAVQYNWALALESLKRFPEAIEKYRYVVELTHDRAPMQEAQSLYHLALCYEATGEDSKNIGALLDTLNRKQYFPEEVVVEIQARLASAYARVSNENQADAYYAKAERGLTVLRRKMEGSGDSKSPEWLGRALYNMGKMPLRKLTIEDFSAGIKPLERGQGWLLQAADLSDETWAPKASFELIQAYRDAWSVIETVPLKEESDPLVGLKEQQDKKIAMAVTLQEVISKLKLQKLPDERNSNKSVEEIFSVVDKIETDVGTLIGSRPIQHGLTSDAEKREGLKREGTMEPVAKPAKEPKARPARFKKKKKTK